MTEDRLIPQTVPWFGRLATLQQGYQYPRLALARLAATSVTVDPNWAQPAIERRLVPSG